MASLLLALKRSGQVLQAGHFQAPCFFLLLSSTTCTLPLRLSCNPRSSRRHPGLRCSLAASLPRPVMQHHYAGGLLRDHSLHAIGDRDFVRKVQRLPDPALRPDCLLPAEPPHPSSAWCASGA